MRLTESTDETQCALSPRKSKRKRMKQSRIPAEDFRAIMQANSRFYSAFSSLDMTAMENLWLKDKRCICHFPGMKRLVGKDKILKSFQHAVDEMDGAIRRNWMEPTEIQVEFQTSEKATVFCQELLYSISCSIVEGELRPESQLIEKLCATNAFKKVDGKWYLWYHQASMTRDSDLEFRLPAKPQEPLPKIVEQAEKENVVEGQPLPPATTYSDMTMSHTFDTANEGRHLHCAPRPVCCEPTPLGEKN